MSTRFWRRPRKFTVGLAAVVSAVVLGLALVAPPTALADDRMQFTGTTLSGMDGSATSGSSEERSIVIVASYSASSSGAIARKSSGRPSRVR